MKFAILRASLVLVAPVALFPGCFLIVGDLPPPLPENDAAAGATDSPGGGSSGAQANGGSAGSAGGAGATSNPCDRDADGHDSEGACGGDDCDDQNSDVHPTQSTHFAERWPSVDYDYDCDGRQEQEQMKAIVCSELPIGDCTTEEGFLDTLPPCGEPGVWGRCEKQGTLNTCMNHPLDEERVMKCQ